MLDEIGNCLIEIVETVVKPTQTALNHTQLKCYFVEITVENIVMQKFIHYVK